MPIDTKKFKEKLLEEKETLEGELSTVARKNPSNPKDWEPVSSELENNTAPDPDERAEKIESFEENIAIARQLEARLGEVTAALDKISKGTYGICSVCVQEIEGDRLGANPAATTCKAHLA